LASATDGFQLYFGFLIEAIAPSGGDFEHGDLLLVLLQEGCASLLLCFVEEQPSDYGFRWGQPATR
jgi:hypothetical protein